MQTSRFPRLPRAHARHTAGVATIALAVGLMMAPPAQAEPRSGTPTAPGRSIDGPLLRLAPTGGVSSLDVDLDGRLERSAAKTWRTGVLRTSGFTMLGLTWAEPSKTSHREPVVRARVRTAEGWRRWQVLPQQHDLPQADEAAGKAGTQPVWVGRARAVQLEIRRTLPAGPTLALIEPDAAGRQATGKAVIRPRPAPAPAERRLGAAARPKSAPVPKMFTRTQWGANPRWLNGTPRYARTVRQIHIHHTASSLSYSRADVPGILRGFYRYHTHSLGWYDIGYNFLVDRFGRAWVGRSGGPFRVVRGAHTLGFNHASVGVAVIGSFDRRPPGPAVIRMLGRIAAWKLDRYHRKPRARTLRISEGSDLFPAGRKVWLKVIDGHRDTNQTACPGLALYNKLPQIRRIAARRSAYFS
ncbi:peptidoglycan recognition protein family protein [Nocardioides insulae]|uniref:peptidoglycan recognition protein family protein n=1 Tax=Nocardioides insulae TaxID=394734 RepID=UPI000403D065|nr:peptidoglycan recognition protein [Nocardioides insulae]